MISSSPVLRDLVGVGKTRDSSNTLLSKEFPAGSLTLVGSNAASGVASLAVRRGLVDELDRCSPDVGGEGDLMGLIRARLSTFTTSSQLVLVSTPTILGTSPIALAYADTDQREYEVPCPSCGSFQTLRWAQIRYPKDQPDKAEYYCSEKKCGEIIPESAKPTLLDLGEWVARNPGHPIPGFYISGLLSPWVPWRKIATEFVAAQGSPTKLQAWVNTRLGECWDPHDTEQHDPSSLIALRESYTPDSLPSGVVIVVAAVDTQDDRLEVEYQGWGLGAEVWHVDYHVLQGDPSAPQVWLDLDNALHRTFQTCDGRTLPVTVTLVDSRGHHTQSVYDFCRVRTSKKVFAILGVSGVRPIWNRRPSRTAKGGNLNLWLIGVDTGKDDRRQAVLSTLARRAPSDGSEPEMTGPGLVHWPISSAYTKAYYEQLLAESPRVRYHKGRPRREWFLKKGSRNEAFDLAVYGRAALEAWKAHGYSLEATAAAQTRVQTAQTNPTVPPPAAKPIMTDLVEPAPTPAEPEPARARRRTSNRLPSFFGGGGRRGGR